MLKNPLPETGYLRLSQIIGSPKSDPPIPPIIPVSKTSWLAGCREGRYPAPVKLGPNIICWRVEDILSLIDGTYSPKNPTVSQQIVDSTPNPGDPYCPGRMLVGSFIFDAVCRCRELSARAKLVFALLCQYAIEKGKVSLSYRTIGHDVGIGQRQAMRAVHELENFGLIKVVNHMRQDGGGVTNVYDFLWHNIYQDQLAELQND